MDRLTGVAWSAGARSGAYEGSKVAGEARRTGLPSIDICVCTYQRPQRLDELLRSLASLDYPGDRFRVVVVDNDVQASAKAVVNGFNDRLDIGYAVEAERGISHARNRALQLTKAALVAFVDDDEVVDKAWLRTLVACLDAYAADVVFGPVVPVLPEAAPRWAASHPFFQRPSRPTGTEMDHGFTGNVIMRRERAEQLGGSFDTNRSLTGGEDTDFFHRMSRLGARLIWCDEAVAYEGVPPERLTLAWICRRGFRVGRDYCDIIIGSRRLSERLRWYLTKVVQLTGATVALPFVAAASRPAFARLVTRICAAVGHLSCLAGSRGALREYA